MNKYIYKNQRLILESKATISIHDRGFLFGDGIFETCKIYNGQIYDFSNHIKRLKLGLNNLKINANIENLENNSKNLITKNNVKNGILKIFISRGSGSLGYLPTNETKPTIIIQTLKQRPKPQFINIGISQYKINQQNFGKTLNALTYILSKIEAVENKMFDNLLLNEKNEVAETSSANIFWIKNNQIYTTPLSSGIVAGTKRQKLLEISPFKIKEKPAKPDELLNADEIFLTNSSHLILEVDEFCQKKLNKNIANQLLNIFNNDLKNSCKH